MKMVDKGYARVCDDRDWSPFIVDLGLAEEVHLTGYPTRPLWKYQTISLWWLIEAEEVVASYCTWNAHHDRYFPNYAKASAWEQGVSDGRPAR